MRVQWEKAVMSDLVMMVEKMEELLVCLAELGYSSACWVKGLLVSKVQVEMAGKE